MTCGECPKGKALRIVGNGITEPPYLLLIGCPHNNQYYKYPDDECPHEAAKKEMMQDEMQ